MRAAHSVIVAAVAAGLSGTAMAQTPATSSPTAGTPTPDYAGETASHWIAAGFVGSNFGKDASSASVDFGGQVGYLWHGVIGGELIADFAPDFKMDNVFLAESPSVNSYMGNAIAALPLGSEGQFQPYISGGIGAIHLKSSVTTLADATLVVSNPIVPINVVTTTTTENRSRFGSNIGGGFLMFVKNVGFRADARYYKASENNTTNSGTPSGLFTDALLSGLSFWRANAGVAFKW